MGKLTRRMGWFLASAIGLVAACGNDEQAAGSAAAAAPGADVGSLAGEPAPGTAGTAAPQDPGLQPIAGTAGSPQQPAPAGAEQPGDPADPSGPAQPADPADPTVMEPTEPAAGEHDLALDECGLDTGYAGDEFCILPPPAAEGFQMHVGPSNYANPDPRYILGPGEESTDNFTTVASNTQDIYFYYRQYRMRPGAHHMIASQGSGVAGSRRIATSNNLAQDTPPGGIVAPENEGVGVPLPANASINVSLHSINVTDEPVLREVWVNFWYVDADKVTDPAVQLFEVGDAAFSIAPGVHTVLGPYRCNIASPSRLLWFYGHRHANNVRFSAWRVRGTQRDLFYEGYDWEEVMVLEFASNVQNPTPDPALGIEGGWTGPLDLMPGDQLEWECEVENVSGGTLRFTNNTYTGEMCIMDGELIGSNCTGGAGLGGFSGF